MKCKFGVGCGPDGGMFRCDTAKELAEHTLTVHADYFRERPDARAWWEADLAAVSDWPPRSEDGLHGATFEWDGPNTAVSCICGFYRITESHEVAEREYMNHVDILTA